MPNDRDFNMVFVKEILDEDEEFGVNTKFVAQFLNISRGDEIHFQDSIRVGHSHILHYAPLLHVIEVGGDGTLHRCKVIIKLFNEAKLISPICFLVYLTFLHQNACL